MFRARTRRNCLFTWCVVILASMWFGLLAGVGHKLMNPSAPKVEMLSPVQRDTWMQRLRSVRSPPLPGMATYSGKAIIPFKQLNTFIDSFKHHFPVNERLSSFKNPCWHLHVSESDPLFSALPKRGNLTVEEVKCLPYFFFLGYPNCGTASVYSILTHHEDFVPASVREPDWWTHERLPMDYPMPSIAKYVKMFEPASSEIFQSPGVAITGDCSTSNSFMVPFAKNSSRYFTDGIPYMFSSLFPDAKFIVIMKDPVERMCSQFYSSAQKHCPEPVLNMLTQQNLNTTVHRHLSAFNLCMKKIGDEHLCAYHYYNWVTPIHPCLHFELHISMYYHSLYQWLHYFPKRQFLFLKTEELDSTFATVANAVYIFLGLDLSSANWDQLRNIKGVRENENLKFHGHTQRCRDVSMFPETSKVLGDFFHPFNVKLAELLHDNRFNWKE